MTKSEPTFCTFIQVRSGPKLVAKFITRLPKFATNSQGGSRISGKGVQMCKGGGGGGGRC